ncbi:elongator complex protein 5 [Battus philenor]|uniref:elongator complex protein 5 n=1 Tax=Battus philenor TaxID=42288 RepID=UPI0035CFDC75
MTLFKLATVPVIVLEDYSNSNILPLIKHIATGDIHKHIFCYEQPISLWENVFDDESMQYHMDFNPERFTEYTNQRCCILIDSVNQMVLDLGWFKCLNYIKKLKYSANVVKLILVLHKDCLFINSKLEKNLKYLANGVVSFSSNNPAYISVTLKLGNKLVITDEILSYDCANSVLKSDRVIKEVVKEDEPIKPTPASLSTFKIEVDQTQQLEKHNLKLPYMSKIGEGQSKVYYEPDAVDDWDDEDPDDDLDI